MPLVRKVWQRHDRHEPSGDDDPQGTGRLTTKAEFADNPDPIEPPDDGEARYRNKRGRDRIGYTVRLSGTCDEEQVHRMTHVDWTRWEPPIPHPPSVRMAADTLPIEAGRRCAI